MGYFQNLLRLRAMANPVKGSFQSMLAEMVVSEVIELPLERIESVRTKAYAMGLELGRKFKVHVARDMGKIIVTRVW